MLTSEASVETSEPARFLAQFCKHAAAMNEHAPTMLQRHALAARAHASGSALARRDVQLSVNCSETSGVVKFVPWGQCTISIEGNMLLLRADANDADGLRQIQDVVSGDLERWGRRENLKVVWCGPDPLSAESAAPHSADNAVSQTNRPENKAPPTGHRQLMLSAAGGLGIALIVLVHLTLAGVITVFPLWLGWTAAGVILVPAMTLAVHAIGPLTIIGVVRHAFRRVPPHGGSQRLAPSTEAEADHAAREAAELK